MVCDLSPSFKVPCGMGFEDGSVGGKEWKMEAGRESAGKSTAALEGDHVTPRFDLIKFLIWKKEKGNLSDSIRVAVASDRMQLPDR